MKVAIPTKNGMIEQIFSKAQEFTIYEVEIELVRKKTIVPFTDADFGDFLTKEAINGVICGSIRSGARNTLRMKRVELLYGASGEVDDIMVRYLSGEIIGAVEENALWKMDREGLR